MVQIPSVLTYCLLQLALKESLRNKFKKTRIPLTSVSAVASMKVTYDNNGGGRKTSKRGPTDSDGPLIKKTRTSVKSIALFSVFNLYLLQVFMGGFMYTCYLVLKV